MEKEVGMSQLVLECTVLPDWAGLLFWSLSLLFIKAALKLMPLILFDKKGLELSI